jgi:hypothetical protein
MMKIVLLVLDEERDLARPLRTTTASKMNVGN